jgi:hypothetical protein
MLTRARSLRDRLAGEEGFTLVIVMMVMSVVVLFSLGAFAAVNGDLPGSADDVGRKEALGAAEVGVSDYLFHLNEDSAYWTKCTDAGPGLNNPWTGTKPPDDANWRTVPGETTSRYAIELLPARKADGTTYAACDSNPSKVAASMVDPGSHGIRIRVTGEATSSKGTVRRQIVTTLRRTNFLDYLWFTDYETTDPVWFVTATRGGASRPASGTTGDLLTWSATNCARYYRTGTGTGYNRAGATWYGDIDRDRDGTYETGRSAGEVGLAVPCVVNDPQFASQDELLGPVHTNDELLTCNGSTFGRKDSGDPIESGRSWRPCSTGDKPNIQGSLIQNAPMIKMPPTDASLGQIATASYTFTGATTIRLGNGTMTVKNPNKNGGASYSLAYPDNGVIYVKSGSPCGYAYQPLNPYNQTGTASGNPWGVPQGCGQVTVSGTYDTSLTIAAQDDIIIDGDIVNSAATNADTANADIASSEQRLGLIADNYIRVAHPVNRKSDPTDCDEPSPKINGRRIDAAMLSLLHSFMVDNYYCGDKLGTLSVHGVIAQKFRGPVGTNGGTGFFKDYNYDQRLAYKPPPHFLDPYQSAWKTTGWTEQQGGNGT